jgi:hypothetical protein
MECLHAYRRNQGAVGGSVRAGAVVGDIWDIGQPNRIDARAAQAARTGTSTIESSAENDSGSTADDASTVNDAGTVGDASTVNNGSTDDDAPSADSGGHCEAQRFNRQAYGGRR